MSSQLICHSHMLRITGSVQRAVIVHCLSLISFFLFFLFFRNPVWRHDSVKYVKSYSRYSFMRLPKAEKSSISPRSHVPLVTRSRLKRYSGTPVGRSYIYTHHHASAELVFMAHRLFEGKEHAVSYQKYRLSPSEQLIGEILAFMEKKKVRPFGLAADVGCGSGQGTIRLAPHFHQVVGMDVSPAQLEMARACASAPNISYRQCPAEELPLEDGSADLVTAMSAAHWFDRPRFLAEAFRVLRPGGSLALLNYTLDMELEYRDCSQELNHICREFHSALSPYRSAVLGPDSTILYKEMFDSIPYPEKEWHDCISVKHSVPVSSYIGMVESFSSYQIFLEKKPEEARRLSQDVTDRLLTVMKVTSPETEICLVVKYYCFLARKPDVS